jgi:hypothetical protein
MAIYVAPRVKRLINRQVHIESSRRVPEGMLNHWYWRAEGKTRGLGPLRWPVVEEITQIGHSDGHICCPTGQEANKSAGAHRILSKGARRYARPLVLASGGQDPRTGASKVACGGRNYSNWSFWPYMLCCPTGQEANKSAGAHRILSKGARRYARPLVLASGEQYQSVKGSLLVGPLHAHTSCEIVPGNVIKRIPYALRNQACYVCR